MDYEQKEIKIICDNLNKRLRRYGYKITKNTTVTSHGEHPPEMPYQVWIVSIESLKNPKDDNGDVVIYPRGIYWVNPSSDYEWNEAPSHKDETKLDKLS